MWIPDPIYKRLPQIYAVAGVTCVPSFGLMSVADASAALLLVAAAAIIIKRRPNKIRREARAAWIARQRRSDNRPVVDLTKQKRLAWRFSDINPAAARAANAPSASSRRRTSAKRVPSVRPLQKQ